MNVMIVMVKMFNIFIMHSTITGCLASNSTFNDIHTYFMNVLSDGMFLNIPQCLGVAYIVASIVEKLTCIRPFMFQMLVTSGVEKSMREESDCLNKG